MNEEVEIKVILKNHEEVENKLNELAKLVKEKTQEDKYFYPKHENFFALKRPLKYLRVRSQGDEHILQDLFQMPNKLGQHMQHSLELQCFPDAKGLLDEHHPLGYRKYQRNHLDC